MTELCELANKWGTDKGPRGHCYTAYYHELFKDKRDIKKVLEIGIDVGRSLFMWQEYFQQAEIFALEADPGRLINGGRIKSIQCNQGNLEDLRSIGTKAGTDFDFMVDDGSHDPIHQILSAKVLCQLLRLGGVYIIEDVADFGAVVPYIPYACETKDLGPDSRLVIIRV